MGYLPTGTVTFVFTDIEASTKLADALGSRFADVLDEHRRTIRAIVDEQGGHEFGTEGDACFLVFRSASAAVGAAADIQRRLAGGSVKVRIGAHTGEGVLHGNGYVGLDLHRVARITTAGHGGQVLLSAATRALTEDDLQEGTSLRDLGEHRLKDLRRPEHLSQLVIEGLPQDFSPLRGTEAAGNLPPQLTSFVGRVRELTDAVALLNESRLVTLTGPGGTGKTRLAIQLGVTAGPSFSGGAWFVPLATLTDPELFPAAVADALGLVDAQGSERALDRVIGYVRHREVLLILDNFEQIVPAASAVAEILAASSMAKVVVTSRTVLRLYGEREYPVPPLGLPDPHHLPGLDSLPQFEAVALFIDRARAVKPGFEVNNENAPAVAEICARLDGLPLAIELAAARIRVLTPDEILARMSDRLALLSVGSRDLPARQQTLRQAIAWSYDLLEPAERQLFTRLAAFVGSCALEQAEAVCGPDLPLDVLDGLAALAEQSLVRVRARPTGTRYGMLQTIREFAAEHLDESPEAETVHRRHLVTFVDLAERAAPNFTTREGRVWMDRLEPDHDNLRAALEWAIDHEEATLALRLMAALWRFWQMRGHLTEGRVWAGRVVAMPGAAAPTAERARALEAAGSLAYWQADEASIRAFYGEALEVAEEVGEPKLLADALYNFSFAYDARNIEASIQELAPLLHRALALYEALGDRAGLAKVRWALANFAFSSGDFEEARRAGDDSVEEARGVGEEFQLGWSLFMRGASLQHLRAHDEALRDFRESLGLFRDTGDLTGILFNLKQLAEQALFAGDPERGVRLMATAAGLQAETRADLSDSQRTGLLRPDHGLSPEAFRVAWAEGESLSQDEAVAYALGEADPFAQQPNREPAPA